MKKNLLTLILLLIFASTLINQEASAASPGVRISQVYGGGGNDDAIYQNDFVELFNASSSPVNLSGWSIQYSAASSSLWHVTTLSGIINAGDYFLIQMASGGATGMTLPTPDATGTTNLDASAGKVALVNNTTTLSGCPTGSSIIDLVGYGTTANCYEGSGATPAPSNTTSVTRLFSGCTDVGDNSLDFTSGTPDPRNSSSATNLCSPTGIKAIGNYSNDSVWESNNHLHVDFNNTRVVNATIEIRNALGQMLMYEKFNSNGIYDKEIGNIKSAYIIVEVINGNEIITKELVNLNQ